MNTLHKNIKEEDSNPDYDETNSLVSNLLRPIYRFVYKIIPKGVELSRYVWYITTLLVLLIGIKYSVFNLNTTIILFILILVLEFASLNFDFIKRFFQKRNEQKINQFVSNLQNLNLTKILDFMDSNNLNNQELIALLQTRHKVNIDLHKKINRTQDFSCDFVDYLVSHRIATKLPPYLLSRYILNCPTHLNEKALNYFN